LTAEEVSAALQRTGVDPMSIPGFDIAPTYNAPQRMAPQGFGGGYGGNYFQPGMTQQQREYVILVDQAWNTVLM